MPIKKVRRFGTMFVRTDEEKKQIQAAKGYEETKKELESLRGIVGKLSESLGVDISEFMKGSA